MYGVTLLDIIISAVLLYFAVSGYRRGFIKQVSVLFGLLVAVLFALEFYQGLEALLRPYLQFSEPVIQVISFAIILVLVNVLVQVVANGIKNLMDIVFLDPVDRIAGSGLGLIKGGIIVYLVVVLLGRIPHETLEGALENSVLASNFLLLSPTIQQSIQDIFE